MKMLIEESTEAQNTHKNGTIKMVDKDGEGHDSEEEIVYSESDSDVDSEDETRAKVKKEQQSFFDSGFSFEEGDNDPWKQVFALRKAQKRKNTITSNDVDVVNSENKKQKIVEVVDIKEESSDDEDSLIDPDEDLVQSNLSAVDRLNIREKDIKKKEKLNKRKKGKDKEAENELMDPDAIQVEENVESKSDITFQEMSLSRPLMKALEYMSYNDPTPIQAATIPIALLGKDILGCAATGTGKTAAFMLPILERLLFKPSQDTATRVLVLVPTRELGVQVFEVSKNLSQFSQIDLALSVGGLDLRSQEANLRKNPDIVIATPGRLIDHLKNTPTFTLSRIEILVLDEADRMLDEFFAEQMNEIIRQCSKKRQTLLFSATMTDQVQQLAAVSLKDPVKLFMNSNKTIAKNLKQEFIKIKKYDRDEREAVLCYLICRTFHEQCIVFIQTKAMCKRIGIILKMLKVNAGELHGNLSQLKRLDALDKFKSGDYGVLLCTDLAARGLDIPKVKTVINHSLPLKYESYVHRVGRTARAGHCGRSISLVGEEEYKLLKTIKRSSNTVVYERKPNKDVLNKYKEKLKKLNSKIQENLKTLKEESEIQELDKALDKMKKKLESKSTTVQGREWFQNAAERKAEEKKNKKATSELKKKAKPKPKKVKPELTEKEKKMEREVFMAQRSQKKAFKCKAARGSCKEDEVKNTGSKISKRSKSVFDKDLTRTDRKSVKKFRHGPSYKERKAAFSKGNPGKKYKHKK